MNNNKNDMIINTLGYYNFMDIINNQEQPLLIKLLSIKFAGNLLMKI